MTSRRAPRVAWSLAGLSTLLAAGALVISVAAGTSAHQFLASSAAVGVLVGISGPLLGAIIVARHPRNRVGWLLCIIGLAQATSTVAHEYAAFTLVARPGSLPAGGVASWLQFWTWTPSVGLLPFVMLLFPDGRLSSARWRPFAWVVAAWCVLLVLGAGVFSWPLRGEELLRQAAASQDSPYLFERVSNGAFAVVAVLDAISLASLFARFQRAGPVERRQAKWFIASAVVFVPVTVAWSLITSVPRNALVLVALVGWHTAFAIAIVRHRLYDIGRVLNRTLVYGVVSALLGLGYVAVVLTLGPVLGSRRSDVVVAGATLAMAALFQPVRRRVQEAVDRRFNRRAYDAARTVEAFSARLRQEIELDALAGDLLAVANRTMEPATASLWLQQPAAAPPFRRRSNGKWAVVGPDHLVVAGEMATHRVQERRVHEPGLG